VLIDGETSVADSWKIANYLKILIPTAVAVRRRGRRAWPMLNCGRRHVVGGMFPLIVADIPKPEAGRRGVFPKKRASVLRQALEEVSPARKIRRGFRRAGADAVDLKSKLSRRRKPNYADYIVFGPFQWRACQPFKLLAENDPVLRGANDCLTLRRHGAQIAGTSV